MVAKMTPGLCPGRYRWAANNINRVAHEGTSHTDTRSPARARPAALPAEDAGWGPLLQGAGVVRA